MGEFINREIDQAVLNVNQTYSYANNSNFYSFVNQTYYDYYYRVVRRLAQWLDGYVIGFHDSQNGIFSTRLASSLVKGISNQICGKQIMFKKSDTTSTNDDVKEIDKWANITKFKQVVRDAVKYAAGLGTSMIKINQSNSELWCEAVRLDYFFYTEDSRGKLQETYCMTKRYNNIAPNSKQERNYYIVEHRFFDHVKETTFVKNEEGLLIQKIEEKDVPMIEYQIKLYTGTDLTYKTYSPDMTQNVGWESIPNKVKNSIKKDYRILRFGEPQKLPFNDHLGCELIKWDGSDISMPNSPFGTSILLPIIAYLMTYDLAWSYFNRDMYNGKGFILAPKQLTENGESSPFGTLSKSIYEYLPSIDPEKQQPVNVQFDLRAESWESIQNTILKKIATTIGMSPKTIASYLEDNSSQKTATEIDAEEDSTLSYIEIHRGIIEGPINNIIDIVLNHKGKAASVKVKFATPSLVNKDKIIDRVIRLLEAGLITKQQAIKDIYPDDDEGQLETRYKELLEYEETSRKIEAEQFKYGF